jgi:hypothetical protein
MKVMKDLKLFSPYNSNFRDRYIQTLFTAKEKRKIYTHNIG